TTHALDLAGAFISPLLALLGGWFLWWWSRRMNFRYGWFMLILYAMSPILVHGTELGRPDHQSLSILLVTIAMCAQWSIAEAAGASARVQRERWSIVSGAAWGLAIWNSAYEPLILFVLVTLLLVLGDKTMATAKSRCAGWITFLVVVALALLVERRIPSLSIFYSDAIFKNWANTIGELAHVSPTNPIWLGWCGYLLLVAPILLWMRIRDRTDGAHGLRSLPIYVLLIATYFFTIWQARWGYFFVLIFALALPALL